MGKTYDQITDSLAEFIQRQPMFFVASAPLAAEGNVNLSPKGLDSLRILDRHTVAYADLLGSGIETVAHLQENGRIVIMFCAFEGAPKILRLHGRGEVLTPDHVEYESLAAQFPVYRGLRSVIRVHCSRISDSCGWGVPLMSLQGQRKQLIDWADKKSTGDLIDYQRDTNSKSIDGLPGIQVPSQHE